MNQCSVNTGVVFTFISSELIRQPEVVVGGINAVQGQQNLPHASTLLSGQFKIQNRKNQAKQKKSPTPCNRVLQILSLSVENPCPTY